jgi:protein-disulfide isomerase
VHGSSTAQNRLRLTCPEELAKSAKAPSEGGAPQPARPTPQAPTELAAPLDIPADTPFRGAANGAVVLQVFSDVQDPFSSRFWPTLNGLVASRSDVKVVFRHAPQPFHKDAMLAHQAALEAFTQKGNDGFWAMHDLLTKNTRALDRAALVSYAGTLKLDVAAFEKALDAGTHAARIEQDTKAAKDARLTGTPVTVLGTHIARGAVPKETLEAFIAGAR